MAKLVNHTSEDRSRGFLNRFPLVFHILSLVRFAEARRDKRRPSDAIGLSIALAVCSKWR